MKQIIFRITELQKEELDKLLAISGGKSMSKFIIAQIFNGTCVQSDSTPNTKWTKVISLLGENEYDALQFHSRAKGDLTKMAEFLKNLILSGKIEETATNPYAGWTVVPDQYGCITGVWSEDELCMVKVITNGKTNQMLREDNPHYNEF